METVSDEKNNSSGERRLNFFLWASGLVVAFLVGMFLGLRVGFHQATFSGHWGENYEKNFLGKPPRDLPFNSGRMMMENDFRNPHGLTGTVISVTEDHLIMKDRDGRENSVVLDEKTVIKRFRQNISLQDILNGDRVVILGRPGEEGEVAADFIRVFENPSTYETNQ